MLAVLGLVGSLLVVAAAPSAAAGDGKPSNAAAYSACVAAATADAGFTDMDGGHAKAAANCLAHYGITTGTAPGMYSPSASVTRAQMAVFLARAAGPAGLDLGAAMDQGFGDIGDYSMTFRDAINRVAKAGIMKGTSMTMFSPDAAVSRADMAVFLDGFVGKALIGPGGLGGGAKYADVKPDDDPFTDLGGVSFAEHGAIRRVYELGIATGTGNKMFSPDASVTRNQMALFITRALAHTNARPAGLSLQADKASTNTGSDGGFMLHAAHRSSTHTPTASTALDLFSAASASAAFDRDGFCKTLGAGVTDPVAPSSRCVIDSGDEMTDSDGNVVTEVTGTNNYCAGTKRVWTWTGANGARFDNDTTTAVFVDVGIGKHWRSINVSNNLKKHATHVRFGQSVTYTLQLVDDANGKGAAVAQKDVAITTKFVETATPGSNTREVTQTHKTDASGRVQMTFSYDDPNPAATGQEIKVVLTGPSGSMGAFLGTAPAPAAGGGGAPPAGNPPPPPGTGRQTAPTKALGEVTWADASPAAKTMPIYSTEPFPYTKSSAEGSGARHTVETQLLDQYGDPVSGVPVHFWSNGNRTDNRTYNDGIGGKSGWGTVKAPGQPNLGTVDNFAYTRTTNSRGIARLTYSRDSAESWPEHIGAVAQIGLRDGAPGTPAGENDDVYFLDQDLSDAEWQRLVHYWPTDPGTTAWTTNPVVVINKAAKEFVTFKSGGADTVRLVRYDSNDHFNDSNGAISLETFEDILALRDRIDYQLAADPPGPGVSTLTNTRKRAPAAATCHM